MKKKAKEYCKECGKMTEFVYDGEQWVCQSCGSYDSRGDFNDSIPTNRDNDSGDYL